MFRLGLIPDPRIITYMKILPGMSEALEEEYTYKSMLALIKCIFFLVQAAFHWFKIHINTVDLKAGLNQFKLYIFLL